MWTVDIGFLAFSSIEVLSAVKICTTEHEHVLTSIFHPPSKPNRAILFPQSVWRGECWQSISLIVLYCHQIVVVRAGSGEWFRFWPVIAHWWLSFYSLVGEVWLCWCLQHCHILCYLILHNDEYSGDNRKCYAWYSYS